MSRVALITGGMGGLGETIATKMSSRLQGGGHVLAGQQEGRGVARG